MGPKVTSGIGNSLLTSVMLLISYCILVDIVYGIIFDDKYGETLGDSRNENIEL